MTANHLPTKWSPCVSCRRDPLLHSLAHSSTTPGRTGKHPSLPFAQKKLSLKKLKLGKRFQQVASLSPPPAVSFICFPDPSHLPPHAMSANIIQPFFVLQPATLSLLSFSRILFSFFPKGELSGSPMPPLIGLDQSPSASWLSSSEVS